MIRQAEVVAAHRKAKAFVLEVAGGDTVSGDALILATVPALALFWLIVPPLAAVAIWVGVLGGGSEEPAVV